MPSLSVLDVHSWLKRVSFGMIVLVPMICNTNNRFTEGLNSKRMILIRTVQYRQCFHFAPYLSEEKTSRHVCSDCVVCMDLFLPTTWISPTKKEKKESDWKGFFIREIEFRGSVANSLSWIRTNESEYEWRHVKTYLVLLKQQFPILYRKNRKNTLTIGYYRIAFKYLGNIGNIGRLRSQTADETALSNIVSVNKSDEMTSSET